MGERRPVEYDRDHAVCSISMQTRTHNLLPLWFIKTKRRRVFDAGGASLEGSALHGVVFDRSGRPQKRAGKRLRLPGSGRESPSDPDSEGVRFGARSEEHTSELQSL